MTLLQGFRSQCLSTANYDHTTAMNRSPRYSPVVESDTFVSEPHQSSKTQHSLRVTCSIQVRSMKPKCSRDELLERDCAEHQTLIH